MGTEPLKRRKEIMKPVKLKSALKEYIWGGDELYTSYGKNYGPKKVAESWELSFNEAGPSIIDSGEDIGKPLKDVAKPCDIGLVPSKFEFFPVLIKLISSDSNLSVQVHPNDEYALKNESQYGKTEMWHVLSAKPGSGLYVGWKRETSPEEVAKAIGDGALMDLLNFVEVKPGDDYFIPSGTVHAIGAGVTLIEIQENSTLTYRLYDYNRVDANGNKRELHVEKSLKVLSYKTYQKPEFEKPLIGECAFFSSSIRHFDGELAIEATPASFKALTIIEGQGTFEGMEAKKGDSFFVPAGQKATLIGNGDVVITEVKE